MNIKFYKRYSSALVLVLVCLLCGACATKADKKEEQSVAPVSASAQEIQANFAQRVQAQDIEGLMALLSTDFTHAHFGSREEIHRILREAAREGFLEGVSVDLANATEKIGEDGLDMIGPIQVTGLFGCINITLYCKEIEKQWYIHKALLDV